MKKRIIVRAYLEKNLGDDLFVHILANRYSNVKFYITPNYKYKKKYMLTNNLVIVNRYIVKIINGLSKKLNLPQFTIENILGKIFNCTVMIGGSIFIQYTKYENLKFYLKERYLCINKNYYILGANFGPYTDNEYYEYHKEVFSKAKDVCFREEKTFDMFKDLKNMRYASDIIFSLNKKTSNKNEGIIISVINLEDRKGLQQYKEQYEEKIKEITEHFVLEGKKVTFMAFCKNEGDHIAINRIIEKLSIENKDNVKLYIYDGNLEESLEIINHCEQIVATRFHAMILGFLFEKKVLPIVYSKKMENTIKDLNYEGEYILINNIKYYNVKPIEKYKLNIEQYIIDANRQFEKLDEEMKYTKK